MHPYRSFPVFADTVDVLLPSASSGGALSVVLQHTSPGGGPPPHRHSREDEIFLALDPGFEISDGATWKPLPPGQPEVSFRHQFHAFRNAGAQPGQVLVLAISGALDEYLALISQIRMPHDAAELLRISDQFGIHFA